MIQRKWGWKPSLPDHRVRRYSAPYLGGALLPSDLRPRMPPVYDQGQLGCHDDRTEVLTEAGWTPWADYDGKSLLGTMNPANGLLEFQAPTALHAYDYDGDLFYTSHRSLDFALTPNHRMMVRRWDERARTLRPDYSFCEAQALGWYCGLPHATSGFVGVNLDKLTVGRRTYSGDNFLALAAAVISCGWVGGTDNDRNRVSFCCFREDRRPLLADLAGRLGLPENPCRRGVWEWTDAELAAWFRANTFTGNVYRSPHKRVPDIVRTVASSQVAHFLEHFGDQHVDSDGARCFYSSSRRMVDDLQELLLRVGKRGSLYIRPTRRAVFPDGRVVEPRAGALDLTLVERRTERLSLERKRQVGTGHYRGRVYCASVPNSLLVTRRGGAVLVSGNSCCDNGVAGLIQYDQMSQGMPSATPSRLFLYYGARTLEGTVSSDSGSSVADALKSAARWGYPAETLWPYDIARFTEQPPPSVYAAALPNAITDYAAVTQSADQICGALAAGKPVTFGFTVYSSFESEVVARTGVVPMPGPSERALGGHCVDIVGYQPAQQLFIVRNSWGASWGDKGHCYFPAPYILSPDLSSDFWVINTIPGGTPTPPTPIPPTPTPVPPTPTPTPPPVVGTMTLRASLPPGYYALYRLPGPWRQAALQVLAASPPGTYGLVSGGAGVAPTVEVPRVSLDWLIAGILKQGGPEAAALIGELLADVKEAS